MTKFRVSDFLKISVNFYLLITRFKFCSAISLDGVGQLVFVNTLVNTILFVVNIFHIYISVRPEAKQDKGFFSSYFFRLVFDNIR